MIYCDPAIPSVSCHNKEVKSYVVFFLVSTEHFLFCVSGIFIGYVNRGSIQKMQIGGTWWPYVFVRVVALVFSVSAGWVS